MRCKVATVLHSQQQEHQQKLRLFLEEGACHLLGAYCAMFKYDKTPRWILTPMPLTCHVSQHF